MIKYIIERAVKALEISAITFAFPMLISLFMIVRENAYMLFFMVLSLAAMMFLVMMIPCLRFVSMIRKQENAGCSFENSEAEQIQKNFVGTYLGDEWIIYAGSVALHYTQIKRISGRKNSNERIRYSIIIETKNKRIYKWPMSQRNVRKVQEWMKKKY